MRLALLAVVVLVGCDTAAPPVDAAPDDAYVAPPDAGQDAPSFVIGDHAPGTTIPYLGGAQLRAPRMVVITYADDANRATLEANAELLVHSAWLRDTGAEYGVGEGSVLANVRLTQSAPDTIASADIETLLSGWIADHTLPLAPDGTFDDVLYTLYFPRHTTITDPSLGDSCEAYGGYHYEAATALGRYAYAVIPNCPHFNPALDPLSFEYVAVSHELFEAATNPRAMTSPGWTYPPTGSVLSPWLFVGSELADLCSLRVGPGHFAHEGGFPIQRIWSNAVATANVADPCVPVDASEPYYALAITPEYVQNVAPGDTVTWNVDAWTTAPMADFRLYVAASGGTFTPDVSADRTMINNGQHATVTAHVPAGTARGTYALVYVEAVISTTEYSATPVALYVP